MYPSPNIVRVIKSRRLRWAWHVARMEEGRSASKILTGKPTGKTPLGRPRRRWEDNIRMDLEEIGISARNWVDSALDRNYWRALVNCGLEPTGSINHGVSHIQGIFYWIHFPSFIAVNLVAFSFTPCLESSHGLGLSQTWVQVIFRD